MTAIIIHYALTLNLKTYSEPLDKHPTYLRQCLLPTIAPTSTIPQRLAAGAAALEPSEVATVAEAFTLAQMHNMPSRNI